MLQVLIVKDEKNRRLMAVRVPMIRLSPFGEVSYIEFQDEKGFRSFLVTQEYGVIFQALISDTRFQYDDKLTANLPSFDDTIEIKYEGILNVCDHNEVKWS